MFVDFLDSRTWTLPFYFYGAGDRHFIESIYLRRPFYRETWPHHFLENIKIYKQRPFYRESTCCTILKYFWNCLNMFEMAWLWTKCLAQKFERVVTSNHLFAASNVAAALLGSAWFWRMFWTSFGWWHHMHSARSRASRLNRKGYSLFKKIFTNLPIPLGKEK